MTATCPECGKPIFAGDACIHERRVHYAMPDRSPVAEPQRIYEGRWIRFERVEPPAPLKTETWRIVEKKYGDTLADIHWYGPWRKYVMEPFDGTIFEEICLREIAAFIEARTKERRK